MNFRFAPGARFDVIDLADWYEAHQAGLGNRLTGEVYAAISRIVAHPRAHGRVARQPRGCEVRRHMLAHFPVVVTYEVTATEVVLLVFTHARSVRQPWRRRLP